MADDFDGSEFVGLDDNLFGDGTADASTKFLSTYAENRLDANARYLQERGPQVTYQFFTDATENTRPYMSARWSALLHVPWQLSNDISVVRFKLLAEILNDDTNTTGEYQAQARIYAPSRLDRPFKGATQTWTSTGGEDVYTASIDVTAEEVPRTVGWVSLWIVSNAEQDITDGSPTNDGWYLTYSDGSTADGAINRDTGLILGGLSETQVSEVWHESPVSNSNHKAGIERVPNWPTNLDYAVNDAFQISKIIPRTATIEQRRDKTATGGGYSPKEPRSMQSQEAVLGKDVSHHAVNTDSVRDKRLCKAIGPWGETDGVDWGNEFRKWSWVAVTDPDTSLPVILDRQSVQLHYDDSKIELFATVAGFWTSTWKITANKQVVNQKLPYTEDATREFVDFSVNLDQLDPGDTSWTDATSIASESVTSRQTFWRDQTTLEYPLANTVYWARHPNGFDDFASEYRKTFREGHLYEDDVGFIADTITARASLDTTPSRTDPVRLELKVDQIQGTPPTGIDVPAQWDHTFHLLALQTSWWEVPQ